MYGCDRYPECDCAMNNPPEKDTPCPDCGGLLLRRPKSFRCWHCGAEADLDLKVTKPGDREAEAAVRAAKSEARKARAAARRPPRRSRRRRRRRRRRRPPRRRRRLRRRPPRRRRPRRRQQRRNRRPSPSAPRRRRPHERRGIARARAGAGLRPRGRLGVTSVAEEVAALRGTRVGDAQGPAHAAVVRAAARGDVGVLAGGLGRVPRGRDARGGPRRRCRWRRVLRRRV